MNQKQIYGLDGLRAFAILGITIFHMFPDFLPGGYLGVVLFFVITGFLLTFRNGKKITNKDFSWSQYYLSRIKRIYPPLLIVIFLTFAIFFFWMPNALAGMRAEAISILLGFNNWWQIFLNMDYFTRALNASCFSHFWFLGIEIQFYILFPFLLWFLYRIRYKKGSLFMIKAMTILTLIFTVLMPLYYLLGFDITRIYYGTDTRLFSLFAGMLIGLIYKYHWKNKFSTGISIGILAIFVILYFTLDGQNPALYLGIMAFVTLLAMIWIQIIGNRKSFLDHPFLKWISKHSYTLYLWQYPIIYIFQYHNFNSTGFMILEVVILILLTIWTDWFLTLFSKKSLKTYTIKMRKMILVQGLVAFILLGVGIYACITSPEADTQELQERIQKNREAISQQPKTKEISTSEKTDNKQYDYSQTGNSAPVSKKGLVFIGDSVLLASAEAVQKDYPDAIINAEVSRHMGQEQEPLQKIIDDGNLHDTIIIALGSNGVIYPELAEQLLNMIGDSHSIFWVNNHCPGLSWQDSNNEYLNEISETHSNVTIVDWHNAVSQHPEWLGQDGIHPTEEGSQAYIDIITQKIDEVINKQENARDK